MSKRKRRARVLKECNRSERLGKQIGRALAGVVDPGATPFGGGMLASPDGRVEYSGLGAFVNRQLDSAVALGLIVPKDVRLSDIDVSVDGFRPTDEQGALDQPLLTITAKHRGPALGDSFTCGHGWALDQPPPAGEASAEPLGRPARTPDDGPDTPE